MNTIKISELPKDIQSKIPYSIKLSNDEWDIDDLPSEIQYIIYEYLTSKPPDIQYDNIVYDVYPSLSPYNDFKLLNIKEAIIDYFKNFIYVTRGSYPFDVKFGSMLKRYLQTKDTQLKQTYISNELNNICNVLSNDYSIPITILSAKINNRPQLVTDANVYSEYFLDISLKINEEVVKLKI